MSVIQQVLVMLVTLGVLIAFHEFGHFWVARRCGVKVLRFSIGFGPVLLRYRDRHGTEYALSALPLGGYVKMLDERESEQAVDEAERPLAFNNKTVLQRMAIVSAGPLANFLLAIVVYWLVFMQGTTGLVPRIMTVEEGSPAARSGLTAGLEIVAVDGEQSRTVRDVALALARRLGDSGHIELQAVLPGSDVANSYQLAIDSWQAGRDDRIDVLAELGIGFYQPTVAAVVDAVLPGSAAAAAGLQAGDRLLQADGEPIRDWTQWVDYVRARPEQRIHVLLERAGELLPVVLTPQRVRDEGQWVGQVGIRVKVPELPPELLRHTDYSLLTAWLPALDNTWQMSVFTLVSLKKMLLGDISYKQLSGPISIAKVATESAYTGLYSYLSLLALLSISLGVLNLLPVPVLDGGHLLFYAIEWIKGSPVPERVQMIAYQLGMVLVLSLMALAVVNDLGRL